MRLPIILLVFVASGALAGPVAPPGDIGLRHDIQVLADYGAITGPVTAWPLSWDAIAADLQAAADNKIALPAAVQQTMDRVLARANRETQRGKYRINGRLSASEKPTRIRGFENSPREDAELSAGVSWFKGRVSLDLNIAGVNDPDDNQDVRADGSRIALDLGNISVAVSTMDRWWGPGWDGSLILSNNARPIPALTLSRILTKPFNSKWLSWLGPWDVSVLWGRLENERVIPNARFFGMRVTIRPLKSLEIGFSRTAQWCGDGRPCDLGTFKNLFLGKDNRGDAGTTPENEPGNQLAGFDLRWSNTWLGQPSAFYAQAIGEDEAGGFPSRYLGQLGIETSGYFRDRWSYRWYAELAGTSCDFIKDDIWNCAYNHGIYETGYRYRGRAIGHGAESDSRIVSTGIVLVSTEDIQWHAVLRLGDLNRAGELDARNTLTATALELSSIDLTHSRDLGNGRLQLGIGYEQLKDPATGVDNGDTRAFVSWRSR